MQQTGKPLPYFLQSFENLTAHFDEHFGGLKSTEKGDTFVALAARLIPLTDMGQRFPPPHPSPRKSHDKGVDLLTAPNEQGAQLYAQAKFKLPDVNEFDSIISKFSAFEVGLTNDRRTSDLFEESPAVPSPIFMVLTSSKVENIVNRYRASSLPSRAFYDTCVKEGRIVEVDGPKILSLLQAVYRKAHLLPTDIALQAVDRWLVQGNVRLGVMRGSDLVSLYEKHGDALFFENVRDFLGATSGKKVEDRDTVNQAIVETINDCPGKLLERNNGITFRAEAITTLKASEPVLQLRNAGIVNGCQTTMSLVSCHQRAAECLIQVKVVETSDAWDVAKSANYQNPVTLIELELAKYLRPQLVQKVGTGARSELGVNSLDFVRELRGCRLFTA